MKVTIFDTYVGTSNLGDKVILDSAERHLKFLLDRSWVIRFATHLSNFHWYQYFRNNFKIRLSDKSDYKIILGTNLLSNDLVRSREQWPIDFISKKLYKGSILCGVGLTYYDNKQASWYTKHIYKNILRKDVVHSVRDEESKVFLESMGFKVINTGCPTLWSLTKEHCKRIPSNKANNVIISLSGYDNLQDRVKDLEFLKIIQQNYSKIYYWVQTGVDREYFESLNSGVIVEYIYSLEKYKEVLLSGDVDYVGSRLHGGVFAMQNYVRSIIIAVDSRALGFKKTNNIVCIERNNIEELEKLINSEFHTEINILDENIKLFLGQFK